MTPDAGHGPVVLTALLLAGAVLVGAPASAARGHRWRDLARVSGSTGTLPRSGVRARNGVRVPVLLVGGAGMVLFAGLRPTQIALAAIAAATVAAGVALHRQAQRRAAETETRGEVVLLAEALVAELRAGQPLTTALDRAAVRHPLLAPAASVARLGGHVPTALAQAGGRPGAEGLTRLSAAWELCSGTGSGLVFGVEQVLGTARADLAVHRQVSSELASARATARLVAALPILVLLASQSLGGDPWRFLLATPAGLVCLAAGLGLIALGLAWIERIATRAVAGEL